MSETSDSDKDLEEKYSDEPQYTVDLNGKRYSLNKQARQRIQSRAKSEYSENPMFSCWWKTASESDAENSEVHEIGDPILVIETEGRTVPWEKLDQLELEMQDTSAFDGVDDDDGMKTVKPGEVSDDAGSDDNSREKNRTHFGVTPQDFQEVPSPEGEDPDKVPPAPKEFDDPEMVFWIPEHPDIEHSWSAGEAMAPMANWVEWNVQAKANQPRLSQDKDDSHDHWESILKMDECEVVGEMAPKQQPSEPDEKQESGSVKRKGEKSFEDGKYGGGHWNV
jgi:hypothetical protein